MQARILHSWMKSCSTSFLKKALSSLVVSLTGENISRNPKGFSQKFDSLFGKDEERKDQWMAWMLPSRCKDIESSIFH